MTVKHESITIFPAGTESTLHLRAFDLLQRRFDELVGHRFFIWLKSTLDMTVKTLRLDTCHTAS